LQVETLSAEIFRQHQIVARFVELHVEDPFAVGRNSHSGSFRKWLRFSNLGAPSVVFVIRQIYLFHGRWRSTIATLRWWLALAHLIAGSVSAPDLIFQPVIGCESAVTLVRLPTPKIFNCTS
jgi:hypothetical protein